MLTYYGQAMKWGVMRRRLPPMEQIEAFVEAGRSPSFRVASERCALSPAAFSRRIQALSDSLGFELFERVGTGLQLTQRGARCLAELTPAYLELRRAATAVMRENLDRDTVRLSISRSLAVGWLFSRMPRFEATHPHINISIEGRKHSPDQLHDGSADIGIYFSNLPLQELSKCPLLNVAVTPVAKPSVARELAVKDCDLSQLPLVTHSSLPDIWRWWSQSVGYRSLSNNISALETVNESYEIASRRPSVAMGCFPTVCSYLDEGRLLSLGLPVARYPGGYWLAATTASRTRSVVQAVWSWLEEEALGTEESFVSFAEHSRRPRQEYSVAV